MAIVPDDCGIDRKSRYIAVRTTLVIMITSTGYREPLILAGNELLFALVRTCRGTMANVRPTTPLI